MIRLRALLGTFLILSFVASCGGRSTLKLAGSQDADGGESDAVGRDVRRDNTRVGDVASASDVLGDSARRFDIPPAEVVPDGARSDKGGSIDARGDGAAPVVLASLELSPAKPTIVVGVPYTGLVATAVFSDGTTATVTASTTFATSDSSVVQVSDHTLIGQRAGSATITASHSGRSAATQVTVTDAKLTSISIEGPTVVSVGQFVQLTAMGVFSDGTKQDITPAASWKLSDPALATIALDATDKARITGVRAGSATIFVSYQGLTSSMDLTVTAATLTSIEVTPVQAVMQAGASRTFQATATYSDNTISDVTLQASWTTSDADIATVTVGAGNTVVRAVAAGTVTITAALGRSRGTATVTVITPRLLSVAVTPATWSANVGGTQAFTATGTYADGSTADLTVSVTWSSSEVGVLAVSNASDSKGQAKALAAGSAQVEASLSGMSGSALVTVTASPLVRVTVTPNPLALVLGLEASLTATASYENGITEDVTAQAAWTAVDTTVSVSNAADSAGRVKGLAAGKTTVTASYGGKSGSASVLVSEASLTAIMVSPVSATVSAGRTQPFTATGSYSNGASLDITTQVTWGSSDTNVAQVSNASGSQGLATGRVAGSAKISATVGEVTGEATLTIGAPMLVSVTIRPAVASIDVGGTQMFVATAVYENGTTSYAQGATWTSSNTSTATISGTGTRTLATGVGVGSTSITVVYQGKSASATLTVNAPTVLVQIVVSPQTAPSILVGDTQQFRAQAVFSDGTTNDITSAVSWTTSDGTVASIGSVTLSDAGGRQPRGGNPGLATGVGAGTVTITAVYSGTCSVSCSDTATLVVRNPRPAGIVITPASATVRVNGTQQFTATLTYDDGTSTTVTTGVSWTTSDGTVASITSAGGGRGGGGPGGGGLATGLGVGTATISATYEAFTDTAQLTVVAAKATGLVVTPASAALTVNTTQAFVATLVYDDNTTLVVTAEADWASANVAVATVTSGGGGGGPRPGPGGGGVATGLAAGSTTISASYAGFAGKAGLTVSDPPISYVQVTPTNANLPVGGSQPFIATVVFTDFTTRNVTAQATWTSSNSSVAVVTGSGGNAGRASALAEGTSIIGATYNGMSGATTLTVAKSVQSISVTPTNPTTVLGVSLPFAATATLSDGTSLTVTPSASWVTSNPSVATVTAGGTVTPVAAGSAIITATYLGASGSSTLTVSAANLSSIAIAPNPVVLASGGSEQLKATGAYDDGTSVDLTRVATWMSSSPAIATVSNASGSQGLLTALGTGSTNVTGVFRGVTSTTAVVTVE